MRRRKKAQSKIINELQNQLMIKAERLGVKDQYTPLWFVERKIVILGQILSEFYAERANLEYELNILGTDKKELLIKLEKLHSYIRKAETLRERYIDKFEKMIDKNYNLSDTMKKIKKLKLEEIEVRAFA